MSAVGWYPDPYGGGGQRWWDGANWTHNVHPAQPQPQPAQPQPQPQAAQPQQSAPAQGAPVFHAKVHGRDTYGDPRMVSFDGESIELAQCEWVRYHVRESRMRGPFGIGSSGYSADWYFEVGRYPVMKAPLVAMVFNTGSAKKEHEAWTFMVDLSRRYLEPRLLSELVARVRNGETVNVGDGVDVDQHGFRGGKVSLAWHEVGATKSAGGRVWIFKPGVEKAVLFVPLQNSNAVLIPRLFSALKQG
ncbi:DUF2510 domain-containing protein [Actinomadura sp. 9N407]|uniref:DUF2510 domain-containing protein n=1 Tax=Actinomadura sp. 9N407 TaxID=3375154 RepID=UPI00378CC1F2